MKTLLDILLYPFYLFICIFASMFERNNVLIYDGKKWRKENKQEVMVKIDLEGNKPCNLCWKEARDKGIYVFPLKISPDKFKRCKCGRMIGVNDK